MSQDETTELYRQLIDGWNSRDAATMAAAWSVKPLGSDATLLHAVAGMVPPGGREIMSDRNAIQTVVANRDDDRWSVALFQTTPARFHGQPELTERLTEELAELLPTASGSG